MLAEARVNTAHFIAKTLLEQGLDRANGVKLEIKDGATLRTAKDQDHQQSNYQESANHFYSVYELSPNAQEEADALIGMSQQLINLQSFRKAREYLDKAPKLFKELPEVQKLLFQAQVEGKMGWIEDYELGYWDELRHFENAVDILNQVPQKKWGVAGNELYSTAKHFSGRARYWLAAAGINKEENTKQALKLFAEAIDLDAGLPVLTREEKMGFGYAWVARCHLLEEDIKTADYFIDVRVKPLWQEHSQKVEKSAIMAHWYVLKGTRDLQVGALSEAKEGFEEAIKIRNKVGQYSQGLAASYLGLAAVSRREGKVGAALNYTLQAAKINPLVILRGGIGG